MPGLAHYMAQYDHEHTSGWNKLLHGIGIPLIFAGIVLLLFAKWIWGGALFVGWLDAAVSGPQAGRQSSGVFPGASLFAGWSDLGGKRGMGFP